VSGERRPLVERARRSKFLRFALVGGAGFFVDAAILAFGLGILRLDPYSARVISFLGAATFTWWGNRLFTFADSASAEARTQEWGRFVAVNAIGGLVNYGVYAGLVAAAPSPLSNPFVALATGSLSGLAFNFFGSKQFVYRG
jgi:putative flippase GtrA